MKNLIHIQIMMMSILFVTPAFAANPFLDAKDDKPVSANFRGTEWNDENIQGEIPLTARMVTTRIAQMSWGAIFKIEFVDLKSRAPQPRRNQPRPDYFIVTDERIVLLNACPNHTGVLTLREIEEDNDCAVKNISAMDKAPEFEANDIYGITTGSFEHQEVLWKTTISLKGDRCVYEASHPSGHFKEVVWKKGVGLIEYASNYGAFREGYRLKRVAAKKQ